MSYQSYLPARNSDPETSHAAAASLDIPRMSAIALGAIRNSPVGLTSSEIADVVGLPRDSISPRIKPLVKKGFVVAAGKRPGPTGRQQIVWESVVVHGESRATVEARDYLKEGTPHQRCPMDLSSKACSPCHIALCPRYEMRIV